MQPLTCLVCQVREFWETVWGVLEREVPCPHVVLGGWHRWCLRSPKHLGALPLWLVIDGRCGGSGGCGHGEQEFGGVEPAFVRE